MSLAKDLLDSIDILASEKANSVKFDKTVRATISEVTDASIGKYKVKYQNSSFFAYALDLQSYAKNTAVYVVIPSSDFEKDPYIIGSVKKLGSNYIEVLNIEDKKLLKYSLIFLYPCNNLILIQFVIENCTHKMQESKATVSATELFVFYWILYNLSFFFQFNAPIQFSL